ncbi:hypothetical protein ACFFV7_51045 [Nonomuraea spiralis]|uniref:Uncharacterized protein n=1 Tax=Nonomuraea spiralis TaxID=46182 RepID=A0ABV5IYF3_9ACTN|nr:hypothetical protein [Nonomuraea spiralis]GGS88368.1 hypothetical protein GCM10010176_035170 [Nonomuraea spiralis]
MADDYRERCADAAMKAWGEQATMLCDHSQIIPIGAVVDAVLTVRDQDTETLRSENEDLRKRLGAAEANVARIRTYIDEKFRFWCSPFGVAAQYANDLISFIDRETRR